MTRVSDYSPSRSASIEVDGHTFITVINSAMSFGQFQFCNHMFASMQIPEEWLRPSIVLLDVGMVTHLRRHEQQLLTELFRAFSGLDGAGMARAALAFSADHQTCPDPEARLLPDLFHLARLLGLPDVTHHTSYDEEMRRGPKYVRR